MVDVDQQNEIQAVCRKPRVGFGAQHGFNVFDVRLPSVLLKELDHSRLDVGGVDASLRPDLPRHPDRVVAGAGADIGHRHAGAQVERLDRARRLLLGFALRTLEPAGAADPHHRCDFASADGVPSLGGGRRGHEQRRQANRERVPSHHDRHPVIRSSRS